MKSPSFEYTLIVPASAIDVMGHVNNVVYLDWVQIAASKHWNHATATYFKDEDPNEERIGIKKMAWVVLDHHISYKAEALEGDELVITTFVEKMTGVRSERHTKIIRKRDQKLLVTAVTNWCLLKMPEAKPMRIPEEISILF
ncbi:acyl-CoA thioesterase [uncultured Dokdonia sp.]|uniref:acyl-CoA thioesterase n=1 Tax=uncultured Dokdonia sp. TaxID=575653 RepID=UPI00261A51B3|nr:acyl-CoA thioesterase [uncultured Dokdonia sp.]